MSLFQLTRSIGGNQIRPTTTFIAKAAYSNCVKPKPVGEITSVKDLIDILGEIRNDDGKGLKHGLLEVSSMQKKVTKSPINGKLSLWFRGQSDIQWELASSISRGAASSVRGKKDGPFYLDEQSALNHLTALQPTLRQHTLFDTLAIVQHHGLPTRLIDWSQSAMTALLFAVEDKVENQDAVDGEFFILNPMKLNYYTIGKYGVCRPEHPEVSLRAELSIVRNYADLVTKKSKFSRFYPDNVSKNFNASEYLEYKYHEYINNKEKNSHTLTKEEFYHKILAYPVATFPMWKDARLQVQQGVFLIDGGKFNFSNHSTPTFPRAKSLSELQEEAVTQEGNSTEYSTFLISYRIPKECKYQIERELRRLGVHRGLLFPELEHQAKYTKLLWSYPASGEREKLYALPTIEASSELDSDHKTRRARPPM